MSKIIKYLLLFVIPVSSCFLLAHFVYISKYSDFSPRKSVIRLVQSLHLVKFNGIGKIDLQHTVNLTQDGYGNIEHSISKLDTKEEVSTEVASRKELAVCPDGGKALGKYFVICNEYIARVTHLIDFSQNSLGPFKLE